MTTIGVRARQVLNLLAVLFITALYLALGYRLDPPGDDPIRAERPAPAPVTSVSIPAPTLPDVAEPDDARPNAAWLDLARAYESLDRPTEAARAYQTYLDNTAEEGETAARKEALERLGRLQAP